MERRTLLAGAGLALTSAVAGCLAEENDPEENTENGANNSDGDDNGTDSDPGWENHSPDGFQRRATVQDVDSAPEQVPAEFDAWVIEEAVTADGTATVRVAVTNTGETERDLRTPYYKGLSDGTRRVMLHSTEAPDSPDRRSLPKCVEEPSPTQAYTEWTDEGPLSHALEPGATGTDDLLLVDDPSAEGCFPPGEYRFEAHHAVNGTEFDWGFTVAISAGTDGSETSADSGDRRYQACPREIIPYKQFPADVQSEIDAALEDSYKADRVFLREAMDTDESFVSVDGTYYEPVVSVEEGIETLALRLVDPKRLPKQRSVSVRHELNSKRMITAELVAEDGRRLVEGTRDLRPGSEVEFGRIDLVGTHELRVTVVDGDRIEHEFTSRVRIDRSRFNVVVVVEEDGITVTGAVAELGVCQYDA